MEKNLIETLSELLDSTEKWVIVDSEGKSHELSEGIAGTPIKINPQEEIYKVLGINPKYITFDNLRNLDNIFKSIIESLYYDASYSVQKKYKDYLETGEVEVKEKRKRGPNKKKEGENANA